MSPEFLFNTLRDDTLMGLQWHFVSKLIEFCERNPQFEFRVGRFFLPLVSDEGIDFYAEDCFETTLYIFNNETRCGATIGQMRHSEELARKVCGLKLSEA